MDRKASGTRTVLKALDGEILDATVPRRRRAIDPMIYHVVPVSQQEPWKRYRYEFTWCSYVVYPSQAAEGRL